MTQRQHGDRCLGATPASLWVAWPVCFRSLASHWRRRSARVRNGYSYIYIYIYIRRYFLPRDIAANIYLDTYIYICIYMHLHIYIYRHRVCRRRRAARVRNGYCYGYIYIYLHRDRSANIDR